MNLIANSSALIVPPQVRLRLLAAIRFTDAFTNELVRASLRVEIPLLHLTAVRHELDATYCFVTSKTSLPAGIFEVEAEAAAGEYVLWEPFPLTLPVAKSPIPPLLRDRFLVEVPIFPTRRLRTRPGETTVVGQIRRSSPRDPAADLRVKLSRSAPGHALETRTDAAGEFFFRVPMPPRSGGGVPPASESVEFAVKAADGTLLTGASGHPATIATGKSSFVPIDL